MSSLDTQQVGGTHYENLAIDPFSYSDANHLDARQHSIIKYVTRFREKEGIKDLRKARSIIDQLIEEECKVNEKAMLETLAKKLDHIASKLRYIAVEGRGGMWAAAQLSYIFNLEIVPLSTASKGPLESDDCVLFVDDCIDTGETLKKVPAKWSVATLVVRHTYKPNRIIYTGGVVTHDEYMIFPISQMFAKDKNGKE